MDLDRVGAAPADLGKLGVVTDVFENPPATIALVAPGPADGDRDTRHFVQHEGAFRRRALANRDARGNRHFRQVDAIQRVEVWRLGIDFGAGLEA